MAAYGYVRPSSALQALSSQAQREEILWAYQERCPGVPWRAFLEDAEASLALPLERRKAGRQLVRRLQAGDHLFLARLDRAFRNLAEAKAQLQTWIHQGITVHLLDCPAVSTSTAEGKSLLLATLAACVEFQHGLKSEPIAAVMNKPAMKARMASRTARGKATNHPGYGFRYRGARGRRVRVEDAQEREAMTLITAWRDQERLSWEKIATRLMRHKLLTKQGKLWQPSRCRRAYRAAQQLTPRPTAPSPVPDP